MKNEPQVKDCKKCAKSYAGADRVLRCRPSAEGQPCNAYRAHMCPVFVRKGAVEPIRNWCA